MAYSQQPALLLTLLLRVMAAEGGGIGLLFLSAFSAQLWKRKTDSDGVASWVLGRTIELNKLLSLDSEASLSILGFDDDRNVVFLRTHGSLFMVQLDSLQFRKLFETQFLCVYHPFASVYTRGNSMPLQSGYYQKKIFFIID